MPESGDKLATRLIADKFDTKKTFWEFEEHNIWNLRFGGTVNDALFYVHAFIQKRPHYCDRGHYQLNIDIKDSSHAGPFFDHQDGFPRYYMDFETALLECERFLIWRILKIPHKTGS